MNRLEKLQKSFIENGGSEIDEAANIIWEDRRDKLAELRFSDCFAQFCKDTGIIDVNLELGDNVEYQIEIPTRKPNSDWTPKVEEVMYSIWTGGMCLFNGVLNINELVKKIREEIESGENPF